jgi:hypothetical protein
MCHVCDEKFLGLGILEFATRHGRLAATYGDQAVEAIRSGDDRQANIAARQASRAAAAAEHFFEEYRRRYREIHGRDPEQATP